jgi:hypothetical protein
MQIFARAIMLVASAQAFAPAASTFGVRTATSLQVGKYSEVRSKIDSLTKDNFSSSLSEIEPFLTNVAGRTMFTKSLKRIAVKAKAAGVEVPTGYAKDAKTMAKRREKQGTFIKAKIEAAAAAKAAEEEAAAAAKAAEEEAAAASTAAADEAPAE